MKNYKKGDIVIVRKKYPDWRLVWTEEMDYYINKEAIVISDAVYENNDSAISLLLKQEYDYRIKEGFAIPRSMSYDFPIISLDIRKQKFKRIIENHS